MLNINGKILDQLDANEYYLFSILLNYGTKSRPANGVLIHRTGWGLQKLQKVKNSLVTKGIIEVSARFDRKDNARGRASNEYRIKSNLCSKYNGVQLHDFKLDENQLVENHVVDFKLDENHVENKVLKLSIIEKNKLLEEYKEKEKKYKKEISLLKEQVKKLKKQLAPITDKDLQGVEFPSNFNQDTIEAFKMFLKMRKEIKEPFKSPTAVQTRVNSLGRDIKTYGIEAVLNAITRSTENQWRGIKIDWSKKKKVEPIQKESKKFPYTLPELKTPEERQNYFLARWVAYKPFLDERLNNTEYRQRAIYQQDAEGLCFELELKFPNLLDIEFSYKAMNT